MLHFNDKNVTKSIMWPNKYIITKNYSILITKSSNQHILKRKMKIYAQAHSKMVMSI